MYTICTYKYMVLAHPTFGECRQVSTTLNNVVLVPYRGTNLDITGLQVLGNADKCLTANADKCLAVYADKCLAVNADKCLAAYADKWLDCPPYFLT